MPYRSERFEPTDMPGLAQAWAAIDGLEDRGMVVVDEVMMGNSHRRRLHEKVLPENRADYVLQTTFQMPPRPDGKRMTSEEYITESNKVLDALITPSIVFRDEGQVTGPGLRSHHPFGSSGKTEDDIIEIYSPWRKARWRENGKGCLFLFGILPPQPRFLHEEIHSDWDSRLMRMGLVVFVPCLHDSSLFG